METQRTTRWRFRTFIQSVSITVIYFASAWLSVALIPDVGGAIIPPIWLPAGVGVWVLLNYGVKRWPSILIGSVLAFWWILSRKTHGAASEIIPAALGAGGLSMLRLVLANTLIRRWLRWPKLSLLDQTNPLKFYLGAMGGNLIAAIAITGTWVMCDVYSGERSLFYVVHGFVSGGLGMVALLPVLLLTSKRDGKGWRKRVSIMVVALGMSLVASFALLRTMQNLASERMDGIVREQAIQLSEVVRRMLDRDIERVQSIRSFWDSSVLVDRQEFTRFAENPLLQSAPLTLMAWAPQVTGDDEIARIVKTAHGNADVGESPEVQVILQNFTIQGSGQEASLPVFFLSPLVEKSSWLGVNLNNNPSIASSLIQARETEGAIASGAFEFEGKLVLGIVSWIARTGDLPEKTPESWIQNLPGVALGVVEIDSLIKNSLDEMKLLFIDVRLTDISNGEEEARLLFQSAQSHPEIVHLDTPRAVAIVPIEFDERRWSLRVEALHGNGALAIPWGFAAVQSATLIVLLLLGGVLLQSMSYTERMEQRVDERTCELAESEARFRQISENVNEVFWVHSVEDNSVIYVSPAFERVWGRSRESIYEDSMVWLQTIDEEDRERVEKAFIENRTSGEYEEVYQIVRPDGKRRWIRDRGFPVPNASGEVSRVVGVAEDITEQRAMEVELKRSNDELAQFAYIASHDLREPLRMVTSFVQLLERRYGDQFDEKGREYINHAIDGARRMRRLIDDLLDLSRIGTQGWELEPASVHLACEDAILNLSVAIEESGADVEIEGDLPVVMGDGSQLIQLFQNLIGNALKFTRDVSPKVLIRAKKKESYWEICVEDNGMGIPEEQCEQIFQIFHRSHQERKVEGTGIGLAVCKRIIERHQGTIKVSSTVEKGSQFVLTLPIVDF